MGRDIYMGRMGRDVTKVTAQVVQLRVQVVQDVLGIRQRLGAAVEPGPMRSRQG